MAKYLMLYAFKGDLGMYKQREIEAGSMTEAKDLAIDFIDGCWIKGIMEYRLIEIADSTGWRHHDSR